MVVYNIDVTIDADENEVEMMKYCNSHPCEGEGCSYWNMCDEFLHKHVTVPYLFFTHDGKPLTSL